MAAAGASAAPGKAAGKGKEILPDLSQGQTRDNVAQQTGIGRYQCLCKEKKCPLGKYFHNENQAETQSEIKKKELSDNKLTHSPANH